MTGGCWDSDDDVTMACLGQRLILSDGRASLAAASALVLHVAVGLVVVPLTVVATVWFTSRRSDCL